MCLALLAVFCLLAPQIGRSQEMAPPAGSSTLAETKAPAGENDESRSRTGKGNWFKRPVESELIWEGLASYGNYNLFAIGDMTKLYTSGVEYDRHSWGYFLRARMDYVAEVLPFVLLVEPAVSDYWGNPKSANRKLVPGVGITPIGLRMMWRNNRAIKPYILAKGGMLAFDQKVLSNAASYENFSLQSGFGAQTRLTKRVDLRLGLWGDFHFSNAYIVPTNPGTDVMNANWGICYHLGMQGL
jgi:hypothetical protein